MLVFDSITEQSPEEVVDGDSSRPSKTSTSNNIGRTSNFWMLAASEMLKSGKFFITAHFCLPSLLWKGRLEWEPVCQARRSRN